MNYKTNLKLQIKELISEQQNLKIASESDNEIIIEGKITINGIIKNFNLIKDYQIKLKIPKILKSLPKAYETGNEIEKSYEHKYANGLLCLDTDTAIQLNFINGFDLLEWFHKYVQGYFISYEYYKRFGMQPFGDRRHGIEGIIDTYKEIFLTDDDLTTLKIMVHIATKDYRGHHDCPCGSKKNLRNCHGKLILPFYIGKERKILIQDLTLLYKIIKEKELSYEKER